MIISKCDKQTTRPRFARIPSFKANRDCVFLFANWQAAQVTDRVEVNVIEFAIEVIAKRYNRLSRMKASQLFLLRDALV